MPAQIIDGTALSRQIRAEVAERAAALTARRPPAGAGGDPGRRRPGLGGLRAQQGQGLCRAPACTRCSRATPPTLGEAALLARIDALNADPAIHGILVQMPLPRHIDPQRVIEAIATHKDVDGFSVLSAGELMTGLPGLRPCTPFGCMKLLESTGVSLRGKHAVVIGRSNTVGKPMALLLLAADATVTVCHSGTPDLGAAHAAGRHRRRRGRPARHCCAPTWSSPARSSSTSA